jgi:branched-chain amino acid transport system ATP-binding protein
MLLVQNIATVYGSLQILHGISFEVGAGQIVALLGSNGAGKTTSLAAVSGLIPLTAGTVLFDGRDISRLPAQDRVKLGLVQVPEGRRIFPGLTVLENLEMGAFLVQNRSLKDQAREQVFELFPKLFQRKDQKGGTLSGGEQQMLALGRGLMSRPRMLLLDEPSLGLAPIVVDKIFQTILEIRRQGIVVLLVEQNARRSLEIADKGYLLETGRIVMEGPGRELLNDPKVQSSYLGA